MDKNKGTAVFPQATPREWVGLAVLMLPTLLLAMDLTVLHLAVPSLTADLQPSSSQLLWITDIYGFMIAGSLITMGTLGDRIGRRRLLMVGAGAFGLASILAAFAPTAELLIAARALLGVAGATLMPSTMSLIRNMFLDPIQRTAAIGIWVSGFSVGSGIGPLIGGVLLENFWWGSVFLLGVPVMLVLLISGPLILPEHKDPYPGKFDLISAGMSLSAILLVIFGLKQFAENGFGWPALLSVIAGLTIGIAFILRQRTLADPLLDLRLFKIPEFSASLTTYTLGVFAAFGTFLFVAQYLQLVLGLSPLNAGLWSVPGALMFVVGSNLSPKFVQHVRPAFVISGGLLLAAAGLGMLATVGTDSLALVVAGNTLMSLGFGLAVTLTVDMVVGAAPPDRAGAASALAETGAELGGALGLAVMGSLGIAIYRSQVAATLPSGITAEVSESVLETLGGAVTASAQLPPETAVAIINSAREAFVSGLQLTSLIGTIVMTVLAVLIAVMLRHVQIHGEESEFEPQTEAEKVPVLPVEYGEAVNC
jgi:DHA2 family multidrug resistance protein-like MFS transporter